MELVFLLFCVGVGASLKSAWDHMGDDRRAAGDAKVKAAEKESGAKLPEKRARSMRRRHAIGWWIREVGGGFPVARTGWHAGWMAHRRESRHQRHIREEARTSDLEAKAAYGPALAEHKRRQKALRDEIVQVCDYGPGRTGKRAVRDAADAVVLHPPFPRPVDDGDPLAPTGTDGPAPQPADDLADHLRAPMPDPRLNDEQRERDGRGQRNICAACGHPGSAGNPLVISDGYRVHETHKTDPQSGLHDPDWPAGIPHRRRGDASPATEGTAMPTGTASETTYDSVMAAAKAAQAQADHDLAAVRERKQAAAQTGDEMTGQNVDSGTLSAQMELMERLDAAEKAHAAVLDAACRVISSLQSNHGGIKEAVDSAPVAAAATPFYQGG